MSMIALLSPNYFFIFVLPRIMIYKSKTTIFSLQSNIIITSLFWKLTKVLTNNLKVNIKGRQILDSSKLREFADDNFKFEENGRKLSKRVENTVGKGEITSNFSFSHSVFKRLVSQGHQKVSLCGNGLKMCKNNYNCMNPSLATVKKFYVMAFCT